MPLLKPPRNLAEPESFGASPHVESLPAIVWTTDLNFRLTSLAGAELDQLDLIGKPYLNLLAAHVFRQSGNDSRFDDAHWLATRGETSAFEIEVMGREFQARIGPLYEDGERIRGTIGIAIESTERFVAQRALRISEESYRSLIEQLPHAICRCTPNGDLLQVNRAMLEMLGHAESDMLVLNLQTDLFADRQHYIEFFCRLNANDSSYGFETQWLRHDGQAISVSLGGRAVKDAYGEISYIDLIIENVSQRKQLESQLRHAQKMQAVGQLAGGIAHDFNNLLTVIRGQVEMISGELSGSENLSARLEEVERAAERATALTRQLLAFSRREVLQTETLELNSVIARMSQTLIPLIGEDIELAFLPQPDLWMVKADQGKFEQVLMNLAVNARDAMPNGGRLTIETHNVCENLASQASGGVETDEFVLLTVRDSGHGMDEATKARIFEPFFTTKEIGKGTGLGLAVVYGVVQQSRGHIRVESQPSLGTSFHVYWPRSKDKIERLQQTIGPTVSTGSETILLVEDNESVRELTINFLCAYGYRVLAAKDGIDAIELAAENHNIALLLSDLTMPRMNGQELAEQLTKLLPRLRVILMSGCPEDLRAVTAGLHFVQKPFSMQSLGRAVREALDREDPGHSTEKMGSTAN